MKQDLQKTKENKDFEFNYFEDKEQSEYLQDLIKKGFLKDPEMEEILKDNVYDSEIENEVVMAIIKYCENNPDTYEDYKFIITKNIKGGEDSLEDLSFMEGKLKNSLWFSETLNGKIFLKIVKNRGKDEESRKYIHWLTDNHYLLSYELEDGTDLYYPKDEHYESKGIPFKKLEYKYFVENVEKDFGLKEEWECYLKKEKGE